MENVTTIKVPFILEDMETNEDTLQGICDNELAQKPAQCFSAKFVDKNNSPILFYFGFRKVKVEGKRKDNNNVGLFF